MIFVRAPPSVYSATTQSSLALTRYDSRKLTMAFLHDDDLVDDELLALLVREVHYLDVDVVGGEPFFNGCRGLTG